MSKITIRFAEERDIDQIICLCADHAAYEQSNYDSTNKEVALKTALFIESPSVFCLVCLKDDTLIGYATYMKQYATWEANYYIYMDCLYLVQSARSKGYGEQLVNKIKEEARMAGIYLIQWQTPDFSTRAIKFYKRIGASSLSKERFFLNFKNLNN